MPTPKLLDQVRNVVRVKHFSLSTERAYVGWIRRFILFHAKKHPSEMAEPEIRQFISHLAINARVSASTQTVALSAILFLYRDVLKKNLPYVDHIERAKPSKKLPVVFTRSEVQAILARIEGTHYLIACLLYGSGLRLMEAVRLRVKDLDFERGEITVREGKGSQDRVTMLPASMSESLQTHLRKVRVLHQADLKAGFGRVQLPFALARKYPNAAREWGWQYVFPAAKLSRDPRSSEERRHHVYPDQTQRTVKNAIRLAQLNRNGSCHTLRHSFATHLLEGLRHKDRSRTSRSQRCTHNDDLYARFESWRARSKESARSVISCMSRLQREDGGRVSHQWACPARDPGRPVVTTRTLTK